MLIRKCVCILQSIKGRTVHPSRTKTHGSILSNYIEYFEYSPHLSLLSQKKRRVKEEMVKFKDSTAPCYFVQGFLISNALYEYESAHQMSW